MRQDRRKFIKTSAAGSAALILSSLESFALPEMTSSSVNKNYDLKIMATSWGYQGTMDSFCAKIKKEGYDGIELWWPTENKKAQDEIFAALKTYDLEIGFLCGGSQSNPQEHLEFYKRMVDAAAKQNIQRPLYINNHSGKDYFSFDDNKKFIEHTQALAKETGLLICHETHRGRMLFAAHITRNFLEKYPDLRLTLDISHWCNVHESLLADQKETIDLALARTDHIHARIGHPEGPQVNDPRAPEWEQTVKQHFEWWDKIVERKRRNGERVTVLTEFGPPDYMPTYPYTRQPLADQWAINVHMMHLLRKRYS
ncbi:MAG: xylose isomerase [Sphingobacteriales bacterium 17-39-43]|uniref:sugar phosphate isomerase/epimerase family protein n=1 Tax=Daejeonella sp. TaxID=2805397 RepID=UPI000BCACC1E|nr:TIM barrel protein [Daejeonella sp.]OYY06099.1 MAG: xylose isomerase [Sphingobacteriia bacterium 35-40-5]OYZ30412.1 MAG: xylose isomerase [Sphingobacteriales bacterium 16-39-50]OYZ58499.1 MAG: xylose isomerase [Sphingobacteriales bacterium 24-40-4]OZA23018.1 MAG: xylose isomerase [Sphingobacteriales bacterium 17-39-43]OZA62055.1 MAG: xylose isomerase [Sphingobacteriales bacterium 39-40-5]